MTNSFVYCWSDKATSKVYVGVHKGYEDDGYICSSKTMKTEYFKRPEDFTRQIISKGDWKDCIVLEKKINEKLIKDIDTTYNRHAYPTIVNEIPPMLGKKHSEETKLRWVGRKHSEEIISRISQKLKGRVSPRKGVKLSDETKNKISQNNAWKGKVGPNTGRKFSEEAKENMRKSALNKPPVSEETRLKLSEAIKLSWKKRKGIL